MLTSDKILQIISAVGWFAKYAAEDGKEFTNPLVCWALIEGDGRVRYIGGIDTDAEGLMASARERPNFAGYVYQLPGAPEPTQA